MNLNKCFATNNDCYKTGAKITPKGVMVHSTGANNPNLKRYVQPDDGKLGTHPHQNHFNVAKPDGRSVCVHAFIGKLADGSIATYQILPWDYRAWHCGSGNKGSGNNTHISFEICEDGLTNKTYFNKVYKEAVELTAYLCDQYGLDPLEDGVVICHKEGSERGIASGHGDVMHWFPKHGKDMNDFRADVLKTMNKAKVETATKKETEKKETQKEDKNDGSKLVRITASVLNVRKGPSTAHLIAMTVKKGEIYTIVEEKNGWGKLKSGAGWIKLSYTTPYIKK